MRRLPRRLSHGDEATLVEHLDELRARLLVSIAALAVGFAIAYAFRHGLIHALNRPLPPRLRKPITLGVAEPFITSVMVSLYGGFLLAMPVILWQTWAFLAPAFQEQTQKVVVWLVVFAALLGAVGLGFGYYVALPAAVHFLTNYDTGLYNVQIRAKDYYSFASLVLLAVTLVFEVPLFILGLVKIGVLSTEKLRRNRRVGYVSMAVLAVALPGVDPVTTTLEMVPLMVLFEATIWISVLLDRRARTALRAEAASISEP